jgi:hypothetical protein
VQKHRFAHTQTQNLYQSFEMSNHCVDLSRLRSRERALALVEEALEMVDEAGLLAAGIRLDQARIELSDVAPRRR